MLLCSPKLIFSQRNGKLMTSYCITLSSFLFCYGLPCVISLLKDIPPSLPSSPPPSFPLFPLSLFGCTVMSPRLPKCQVKWSKAEPRNNFAFWNSCALSCPGLCPCWPQPTSPSASASLAAWMPGQARTSWPRLSARISGRYFLY